MKTIYCVLCISVVAGISLSAQSYNEKPGVVYVRNVGLIRNHEEVVGYYNFFMMEHATDRVNNYKFVVYDGNMVEVNSVKITRSSTFRILEAAFNGKNFVVLGFDPQLESMELMAFDTALNQTGSRLRKVKTGNSLNLYGLEESGNERPANFLVPVENKGFLFYGLQPKHNNYTVDMLSGDLNVLWTDIGENTGVDIATGAFLDDRYVGSLIERKGVKGKKGSSYFLMVNDPKTGDRKFVAPLETPQYTVSASEITFDSIAHEFVVFGQYFDKGSKPDVETSLGFAAIVLDENGKQKDVKTNPWFAISQVAPLTSAGAFDGDNSSMFFHRAIRTSDGQIFVVGEQYKPGVNPRGVASQIAKASIAAVVGVYIGGGKSAELLEVHSMVIMQFKPDYSLNKVYVFEKGVRSYALPSGSLWLSPRRLAIYAKTHNFFDYEFTEVSKEKDMFSVTYLHESKHVADVPKTIGSIIYTPQKEFVVDKIELQPGTLCSVVPGENGFLRIREYFPNEKKTKGRIEKINY